MDLDEEKTLQLTKSAITSTTFGIGQSGEPCPSHSQPDKEKASGRRVSFKSGSTTIPATSTTTYLSLEEIDEIDQIQNRGLDYSLSPNAYYFLSSEELSEEGRTELISCLKRGWTRVKMYCGCGGRLCLFILLVQILILGIVLPGVRLQSSDPTPTPHHEDESPIGYANFGIPIGQDYAESTHVAPPTSDDDDHGDDDPRNTNPTPIESGDVDVPPHSNEETKNDDDHAGGGDEDNDGIVVVQHEDEEVKEEGGPPPSTSTPETEDESDENVENEDSSGESLKPCDKSLIAEKLDQVMKAISAVQQSVNQMENLMQGPFIDDLTAKCVSEITSSNFTQASKVWTQISKYTTSEERKQASFSKLVKEAYGGRAQNILAVAEFIKTTGACEGWSILLEDMEAYGHVFGHPFVFTVALKIKESCNTDEELVPDTVKKILKGGFTLQNKFNKGFLYYAKKCVARHYFHCLDVLTKRAEVDELKTLEEGSDEWRRYHWKVNASDGGTRFFILNEDKYMPYRLQDLSNSPRFKMEEASSGFEVEMGKFQLILKAPEEIAIQVRDTDMYLEGESSNDGKAEVLLHSYHKVGESDEEKILWLVKVCDEEDDDEEVKRLGRSSGDDNRFSSVSESQRPSKGRHFIKNLYNLYGVIN